MMTYKTALTESITASADVVKNRFANFSGGYCGAGEKALGVFELDTDSGEQAPVIVYGIALVEAGGAIAVGDAVTSDADGKAVKADSATVTITSATGDGDAGTYNVSGGVLAQAVNGYALDAASAAGEVIRVRLV